MTLLSIGYPAPWRYLTNTGPSSDAWPRYVGFGLDDPPIDNAYAQPGFDDSDWAIGSSVFHNGTWGPDNPWPAGTIYGGVVHDGNDKIWARCTGITSGGDLHVTGFQDNFGAYYIDGYLIGSAAGSAGSFDLLVAGSLGASDSGASELPSGPLAPGEHTFAFYGSGDGLYDAHYMAISESAPIIPPPDVADLSTAMFAGARPEISLTTSPFIPGGM